MAGFQRVTICGNVGKDPEVKSFDWGTVCNFSIATSETWKDKATGEKKERTEWHKINVRNEGLIKNVIVPYVKKGSTVLIEGILQTRDYEKDGVKHYTTEVVIAAYNGSLTLMGSPKGKSQGGEATTAEPAPAALTGKNDMDDDIPFSWAAVIAMPLTLLGLFAGIA